MKTLQDCVNFMILNSLEMIVWNWKNCPLEEKHKLSHGGDEDEVVILLALKFLGNAFKY